jgi:hypothetical protein
MEFIQPDLVYSASLSVRQHDGFADQLGLSFVEFGQDCARSGFGDWHDAARFVGKGSPTSHMKTSNWWQTHGNRMSKTAVTGT